MPPVEHLLSLIVATTILAVIPGPGMLYMSVQTMAHGPKAGWLSAASFHLGAYVHIVAAAFGITGLLHALPVLFVALKVTGAAYLIWMGARMLLDKRRRAEWAEIAPQPLARQAFRDSLAVGLLNPKTALFYLAFLPQFASSEAAAPIWLQIVVLGILTNVIFSVTDAICILCSQRLALLASASCRLARIGRRIGGIAFITMGLNLAVRED